jgi:hypothetical protein
MYRVYLKYVLILTSGRIRQLMKIRKNFPRLFDLNFYQTSRFV